MHLKQALSGGLLSLTPAQNFSIFTHHNLHGRPLGIFGSYVRGEQKGGSDIDILVEFDEFPDIFQLIDLEDDLRKLLKRKVDLVRKGAIRPELKDGILKEVVYL